MEINKLDRKAKEVARKYRTLERELLALVIEIDQRKIFYRLGYNSLFAYLTQALKLSPAITSAFVNVARKAQEIPELQTEVEAGHLSIYKAQRITSVLTTRNSRTWLSLAKKKTHRELEREVAIASPKNAIREKAQYIPRDQKIDEKVTIKKDIPRLELRLGVSESLMLKIRRAQDLESQRNKKNLNLEETLEYILALYLEKRDPIKKAQRQKAKGKIRPREKLRNVAKNSARAKRKALPSRLKHQLQLRDNSQCTFVDPRGQRCSSKRFLEAHHIVPISQGGEDNLENLRLLCSGHHKAIHTGSKQQ